ncbi:MAG TPA: MATE family efflux transporter [Candidatus Faecivivens stercoravium]|uniref:MATE family efflux transporter n=1 Tax=Candidatus Faecivivens stercoravium TaxID=2840803 RepID=A0A9D1J504_9FIRM|nr:MATE family efflux transporter [Candidatus Faecivivens stercoravium]
MKLDREFWKKLRSLVFPIAFQQVMLALVSATDAVMLGMLSQDAMSAVSLAGQVQFVFSLYLATMTIGTSMFAAQYWGKRDVDTVERLLGMVLLFTLPVGLLFTLAAAIAPGAIMRIFTPEPALVAGGAEYLRAVSLSYFFCGISQVFLCVMKNCGRAGRSSLISSACVLLNILFNAILIFGLFGFPEMGIAGAAVATVIARAVDMVWAYLDSLPAGRVKFRPRYLVRLGPWLCRDFWKYVTPVLGNEIVWGVGFTMGSVILGHMGSDAVAANSIASIAKNLLICLCTGIGSGGAILVGNELGAGRLDRAKRYGEGVAKLSIVAGTATGAVLLCLSPLILRLTNLTPTAEGYLQWMLVICSYYCIGKSVNSTVIGGIFCAGGDSKFGFLCDAVTLWVIVVPLGMLAAFVWKLPVLAVYFIINLDEMIKLPAVYRHFKQCKWVKNLTKEEIV